MILLNVTKIITRKKYSDRPLDITVTNLYLYFLIQYLNQSAQNTTHEKKKNTTHASNFEI